MLRGGVKYGVPELIFYQATSRICVVAMKTISQRSFLARYYLHADMYVTYSANSLNNFLYIKTRRSLIKN